MVRLTNALAENGAGRRAIFKAEAGQQGITDDEDLERLYESKSEIELEAPKHVRRAMIEVGLQAALARQ